MELWITIRKDFSHGPNIMIFFIKNQGFCPTRTLVTIQPNVFNDILTKENMVFLPSKYT